MIYFYNDDYTKNWTIYVPYDASDEAALAEAEKFAGPLTEAMKKVIREARRQAYTSRFSGGRDSGYEGGSSDGVTLSILPKFLREDDLTDWLFTYQIDGPEAYLHAVERLKISRSDTWLMAAISKADASSADLPFVIEAAKRVPPSSPAFATVSFHLARLYLAQGKRAEAIKILDDFIGHPTDQPISTFNQFLALRTKLAGSLDEFLHYALRKPFAFNTDGETGSIDELIARDKSYYDPSYNKDGREAFDREVEDRYRNELLWKDRLMLDSDSVVIINDFFPQSVLLEARSSSSLPTYVREQISLVTWTRAVLLNDMAMAAKLAPDLARSHPELRPYLQRSSMRRPWRNRGVLHTICFSKTRWFRHTSKKVFRAAIMNSASSMRMTGGAALMRWNMTTLKAKKFPSNFRHGRLF